MRRVYFPSCKVNTAFSESSALAEEYLSKRWQMEVAGCCRTDREKLSKQEAAVVVCHTCAAVIEESSEAEKIEYIWEFIDKDDSFVFPNYRGEKITIQDCTMAKDYLKVMEAVRSLLRKMNLEIVELPNNRKQANFCGLLTIPILEANLKLAPKRFGQKDIFKPLPAGERELHLQKHTQAIQTKRVVCYCKACHGALGLGGADVVHLLELLFPAK